MHHVPVFMLCFFVAAAAPASAAQAQPTKQSAVDERTAEALREHLDEAEDVVSSLLRWQHITTWSAGNGDQPPSEAPRSTLISIERAHAATLVGLVDALAAQVPESQGSDAAPRGDLRAHVEKARTIARELMPPAAASPDALHAEGGLVTVDRTALERLEIELDAVEELLPRITR